LEPAERGPMGQNGGGCTFEDREGREVVHVTRR
jgi:hypothetical protein